MAQLTVKLLSHTAFPIETYYLQYMAARTNEPLDTAENLFDRCLTDVALRARVREVAEQQMALELSVSETIWFVFAVENICIALREQLVRHRIGHCFGGRTGVDIIPGSGTVRDSTFWSQTTRLLDMSKFADDGQFLLPEGLTFAQQTEFSLAMKRAQEAYKTLEAMGVHRDDARMVLPTATQHRMTWSCNLSSLRHVLKKRTCWIAQLGIWEPLIVGITDELRALDPLLARMADPPCIKNDRYCSCPFEAENTGRIVGRDFQDPATPCSLYLHNEWNPQIGAGRTAWIPHGTQSMEQHERRMKKFGEFWNRDPLTGDTRLPVLSGANAQA